MAEAAGAEPLAGKFDQISTGEQAENSAGGGNSDESSDEEHSEKGDDGNSEKNFPGDDADDDDDGGNFDNGRGTKDCTGKVQDGSDDDRKDPDSLEADKFSNDAGTYTPTAAELLVANLKPKLEANVKPDADAGKSRTKSQETESENDDDGGNFPNTSIALEYVGGNK